jgi:uncharacterized phiE125 gp8 family phage protein
MTLISIFPPDPLVTLAEAKAQLRVDNNFEDSLINLYIQSASERLDGPNGILGKAFSEQMWRKKFDSFPSNLGVISLPVFPVISVQSLMYIDENEDETTMTLDTDYRLSGDQVIPLIAWPSSSSITIDWIAGIDPIPAQIKQAALWLVSHSYRNREATTVENMKELPLGVYDLVSNIRKVLI